MTPTDIKSAILYSAILVIYGTCKVLGNPGSITTSDSSSDTVNFAKAAPILPANKNNSIQYLLYTADHPKEACYFEPDDSNECSFNVWHETKVLIHGYTVQLLPGNFFEQIKDTLLQHNKYNVVIVNWTKYNGRPYLAAVAKAYPVAIHIGRMINFLVSNRGVNASNVHIIGHSLGAHVAGVAGKQIPNLRRVTGLDPAGPLFTKLIKYNRLSNTSAQLVDVIHTSNSSGIGLGLIDAIGTIDFYPNGGNTQPACQMGNQYQNADAVAATITTPQDLGSCYHNIALPYFMYSINFCNYLSEECTNYEMFSQRICNSDSNPTNRMGLFCVKIPGLPAGAKFYLNTTANPPYCENEYGRKISI